MKTLFCFTALSIFGQNSPALQCVAHVPLPPTVRSEGLTELVGDVTLNCTGGTPTPAGTQIATANFSVTLNTGITSRVDALLLVDEPPPSQQLGCLSTGGCSIFGTGNGVGTYSGAPGRPNIFPGTISGPNTVSFFGVAIDPPGTNSRIIRITNVRANANQLSFNASTAQVTGSVAINSPFLTFNSPPFVFGNVQPGLLLGAPVTAASQWCPSDNGGQIVNVSPSGLASPAVFGLQFTENFATAFKTRVGAASQNVPGVVYHSESAFVPSSSAGLPVNTGLADFGTRLRAIFSGVPPGVTLILPTNGNLVDSKGVTAGTYTTTSPTGVVSGNNTVVSGDSTTSATVNFEVMTRDPNNLNPVSLLPSFTVGGALTSLQTPYNFILNAGYPNPTYWQNGAFAPGSALLNPLPIFGPLHSGVAVPPLNSQIFVGSVVGACADTNFTFGHPEPKASPVTGVLNTPTGTAPAFINVIGPAAGTTAGPNLIAPRISNVGVVSAAGATTGVTVTKDPAASWLNVNLSGTTTPLTAFLSVNNAAAGNYSTSLTFSAPGGLTLSVPVTYTAAQGPWFSRYGFAHSASYVNDVVAPGGPFVIFGGDAFGPAILAGPALDANGLVSTTIGNTQVLFDGTPAPLYYSVAANGIGQIAGFAPFELATKTQTNVQVVYNGVTSPPVTIHILDAMPGLYTADSSGGGQGAILNHDLSVNGQSNPESVGNLIVLYGGGAGQTSPAGRDGGLAGVGAPVAQLKLPVKVFIDGIAATNIQYAGPAPGLVEGVFQINVAIPDGVHHGANVPVVVQVEDKQTQSGVTVAVK